MHYSIRHLTRFRYSATISESIMEVRMHPRSEGHQRCLKFTLETDPRALVLYYRDFYGNIVHHFDVPGRYDQLTLTAEALVEVRPPAELPPALTVDAWHELDATVTAEDFWDYLVPSHYARPTPLLREIAAELSMQQRFGDPLTLLHSLNSAVYRAFSYVPRSTRVDSPIDEALHARRGVCQDFAHIMITIGRELRIPCRYVSGYLFHRREDHDRSEEDATHAWVEAYLPNLGWIGFDPTNDLLAGERHIRTAVGRDYADVPPTRGVYKGNAQEALEVGVQVVPAEAPLSEDELLPLVSWDQALLNQQEQAQEQTQMQQQ